MFLVPVKGGIGSIFHTPEGKDYKWYVSGMTFLPIGGWTMPPTYHLLPGTMSTTIFEGVYLPTNSNETAEFAEMPNIQRICLALVCQVNGPFSPI